MDHKEAFSNFEEAPAYTPSAYPPAQYPHQTQPTGLGLPGVHQMPPPSQPTGMEFPQQMGCTTHVVVQQPSIQMPRVPRQWSSGKSDCLEAPMTCLAVCFCDCCYVAWLASEMGESCCLPVSLCGPGALLILRVKLRTQHNIQGSLMKDNWASCCCYQCTACQLGRELTFIKNNPEMMRM